MPSPLRRARALVSPPRLAGLDVARALAVIGMVGAHVGDTSLDVIWRQPSTWDGLVHGRSAILFAVLAGVSVALVTGRRRRPGVAELPRLRLMLVGRGAAIFAIGVLLELLGTEVAVILTLYGVLYVAALPFLAWRRRSLWIAVGVLTAVGPALGAGIGLLSPSAWGGAGAGLVLGFYPLTVWLAFLLAGLAIGRSDLRSLRTAGVLVVVGLATSAVGYGAGAAASGLVERIDEGSWAGSYSLDEDDAEQRAQERVEAFIASSADGYSLLDESGEPMPGSAETGYLQGLLDADPLGTLTAATLRDDPHSGGALEILGSGGLAVAVIGLCLLLAPVLRWPLLPLSALGSMPLSAYAAHLVAIVVVTGPGGFIEPSGRLWAQMTLWLLVGATMWALLLGRGPLERLVGRSAQAAARGAAVPTPAASGPERTPSSSMDETRA